MFVCLQPAGLISASIFVILSLQQPSLILVSVLCCPLITSLYFGIYAVLCAYHLGRTSAFILDCPLTTSKRRHLCFVVYLSPWSTSAFVFSCPLISLVNFGIHVFLSFYHLGQLRTYALSSTSAFMFCCSPITLVNFGIYALSSSYHAFNRLLANEPVSDCPSSHIYE
jgi:hypothetical protein